MPSSTPKAAETASVKRTRGHAKMRAKPVGIAGAAEVMARTIEHRRRRPARSDARRAWSSRRSSVTGRSSSRHAVARRMCQRAFKRAVIVVDHETEKQDPDGCDGVLRRRNFRACHHRELRLALPSGTPARDGRRPHARRHPALLWGAGRAPPRVACEASAHRRRGAHQGARFERQSCRVVRCQWQTTLRPPVQWHRRAQKTHSWDTTSRASWRPWVRTSRCSSPETKCSAEQTARLRSTRRGARKEASSLKPSNMSFEEAAAIPIAAITALQGLRDKGHIAAGQEGADQWRVRWRWNLRSADREILRCGSDRSVQHSKRGDGAHPRRGSRRRLHEGELH